MKKFFYALIFFALILNFSSTVHAKQVLSGGQIESMAISEVEAILDERGEFRRREVMITRSLSNITLPEGIIDVKIMLPSTSINYSTGTPVKARIFINGKPYRDVNFIVIICPILPRPIATPFAETFKLPCLKSIRTIRPLSTATGC